MAIDEPFLTPEKHLLVRERWKPVRDEEGPLQNKYLRTFLNIIGGGVLLLLFGSVGFVVDEAPDVRGGDASGHGFAWVF